MMRFAAPEYGPGSFLDFKMLKGPGGFPLHDGHMLWKCAIFMNTADICMKSIEKHQTCFC